MGNFPEVASVGRYKVVEWSAIAEPTGACEGVTVVVAASSVSEAAKLVRAAGVSRISKKVDRPTPPSDESVHVALQAPGRVMARRDSDDTWRPAEDIFG
ncbi:MAG: hypothetical protein M3Q27_09725 [Actinomycetota bacterium]|nr:hypothetical protein [Actinomycetota bacterium]